MEATSQGRSKSLKRQVIKVASHQSGKSSKQQFIEAANHQSSNSTKLHSSIQLIENENM
jgi:hypothetical protein